MKKIRSILIVDDSEADVFLCRLLLQEAAPNAFEHILTASDGLEALELFQNYEASRAANPEAFPPVVILLDINMPRMDGFEFLEGFELLRETFDDIAPVVLMVTSSSDKRDKDRASKFDFVKLFLTKPPRPEDIEKLVEMFGEEVA